MGMSTESQSNSSLNDSLSWDVNFYEPLQKQNDDDHEVLTALVRTSYLSHLQRSLNKNYDRWLEMNPGNDDLKCCLDDILKCASYLERQALRACMITHFYQRAMVKTMKEIKKSTEEGSLFSPLIEQLFDNKLNKTCDKEIQTNVSLFAFHADHETQEPKEKTTPTTHYTLENSNLIIINPCNEIKEKKDDLDDLFTILMTSPTYSDSGNRFKMQQSPKKRKYIEELPTVDNKFKDESLCCDTNSYKDSSNLVHICPPNKKERLSVEDVPNEGSLIQPVVEDDEYPSVAHRNQQSEKHKSTPKTKTEPPPIEEDKSARNSYLDERLKALADLFGEDTPKSDGENDNGEETVMEVAIDKENLKSSDDEIPFKYPVDWKTELAAQICNLKIILSRLPRDRLITLHDRFKVLFGSDKSHLHHSTISSNEEALSRKRTASIVVGELTPHYIGGKIGSRQIFKSLAKKITDTILLTSYVADYDEISQIVNSCFINGRRINSEKDVENTPSLI